MPVFQSRDDAVQLDAQGSTVIGFDRDIDQCQMTVQHGAVTGTCQVIAPAEVKLTLFKRRLGRLVPAAGAHVVVSLLGVKN